MHAQTCMVQLGNLHGWTSQLAWFSSPKCMVPLPALHGWTKKGSSRHCDPQHSTHICASTSPSGSVSPKIIQERSQGATPGHRTLPLPNFARCDTTTSHPATLSCCTLQHRAIAPCHFRLSHPATQNDSFGPLKPPCASSSRFHSIHNPPPPIEWQGTFTLSMSIIREESFLSHNHSFSRRWKQVHYLLFTWRGYICAAVSRQTWTSSG